MESVCPVRSGTVGSNPTLSADYGAVAQLGERHVRNVQVEGSSPFCSTKEHGYKAGLVAVLGGELAVPCTCNPL